MNLPIPDRAHLLTVEEACQALGIQIHPTDPGPADADGPHHRW
jgi:hypothetical protein